MLWHGLNITIMLMLVSISQYGDILMIILLVGKRDISDLDDKNFVRLRRFRNLIVTIMYCIVFIFFIVFMSFTSHLLILILN